MKKTNTSKSSLQLKRKLQLVRTTIRELTPEQLQEINAGNPSGVPANGLGAPSCVMPYTQPSR